MNRRAAQTEGGILEKLNRLLKASEQILSAGTVEGLLKGVVEAAREITAARIGAFGHGYVGGSFTARAVLHSEAEFPCQPGGILQLSEAGAGFMFETPTIRLQEAELNDYPYCSGLGEGGTAFRGLLGARLLDKGGKPNGLILVSDKKEGEFTEEDEVMLGQLAATASLGLQLIAANAADPRPDECPEGRPGGLSGEQEPGILEIKDLRGAQSELERYAERLEQLNRRLEDESEALRESEERFTLFLDYFPGSAYIKDAEGRYLYMNRYTGRLLGKDARYAIGMTDFDLWPAEIAARSKEDDIYVLSEKMVIERVEDLDFNGRPFYFLTYKFPLIRKEGIGLVGGISIDITKEKLIEIALEESKKRLEESNRALQDFAYIASHDLQEPLRKIQAFGGMLAGKYGNLLDEAGLDYLERMQNAAERMSRLIISLLEYSRVATRGQPFVPVELTEVVQEALSDLEIRLKQTGGKIMLGKLITLDADPSQMRQLFQNLIGNALKFHGDNTPTVKIYGRYEKGQQFYRIYVEDNGIGFDEAYKDKIFLPFERLYGRSAYEGTGMGLAICRKIVRRHGGDISAKSTPGKGSTFIVRLPVKQV
jgi:PAS domain S-box-containing protein